MKLLKNFLTASLSGLLLLFSCTKDDKSDQPVESKFTWTYNGIIYDAKQHHAATSGLGAPSIFTSLLENSPTQTAGPRINLTSLQQGTYVINLNGTNRFEYIDDAGDIHAGTAGNLNITKNTGTTLNGNFSVTLTNNKSVTGEFVNTVIKQ